MSESGKKRFGRRGALLGIGLAAAGAASGFRDEAAADEPARWPARGGDEGPTTRPSSLTVHDLRPASRVVRALFGDHRAGTALESHWRIEAIYDVRAGAIPLVLATTAGTRFAVEVFRTADDERPVASAGPLALYLVNRGDGGSSTDESAGLGVLALGRALASRLSAGASIPPSLLTFAERRRQHPTGVFHVPTD